ncbi:Putative Rieske 2Fe-2S iron-sulfur YhfW-like protein [Cladobotryum mycophilum]|uniref:Rieske 2Fe-2S iron-sulfur YhfW-like protein n=1 Tax=Cladobotryum mycophilum TaxID=491253 RepID=A0ABR0T030_9HYPO
MPRNICITAVEGQTGFLIAELLLKEGKFSRQIDSLTGMSMNTSSPKCKELEELGATIVPHEPGRERDVVKALKEIGCDTICLIPPAHPDKYDITVELVNAAKKAGVTNTLLISSVGCDYADPQKQPRLREFIDIESLVMATKGDPDTQMGHSPCVIRAGFYAENLLLYSEQAKAEGVLPLPIGENHKFAPVALGDVAHVAAHVLAGKGKQGFDDRHRGQMMVITGPMLCAGEELAQAASSALGTKMEFENISDREAKKVLASQSESSEAEKEYILEYYSLVREGKMNYISTTAFHDVTGTHPTEPSEFFKMYAADLRPRKKTKKNGDNEFHKAENEHFLSNLVTGGSSQHFEIVIRSTMAVPTGNKGQFAHTTGGTDAVWVHKDPYSNRPQFQSLSSDLETEICVIGAGIAGISIAYELVSRGHEVTLVEGRDVISGESGRTSGHLSTALDDHYTSIKKKHGLNGAQAAAESHQWAVNRIGEVAKELNIECEYRRVPGYEISQYERNDKNHESDAKDIKSEAELAKQLGLSVEFREGLEVRGWTGKPDQRDGAVFSDQAAFHPTKYLVGILNWLKQQSTFQCFTGTRVMSVEEQGLGIVGNKQAKVTTESGHTIKCDHAVEATCVPLQKLSIIVEMEFNRTYCIAIRVPRDSVEDCFIYDSADPYHYIRLTACDDQFNYMIVGGGDHKVGQESPAGRYEELEQWTRDRFPQAGAVDYRWSGQIYEPVDHVAFIGQNQGNQCIYVVTGDSGNGLTHGVIAGRLIADLVDKKDNPWTELYSPSRLLSIAKSAPSMIANDIQVNTQYKRFLESDIQDIEDLTPGTGGILNKPSLGQMPTAIYRDENGKTIKMSALCPHLKGVVCWNPAERTFDCPIHGSRFSSTGVCLNGPAKTNLEVME